ncbi:MAG TPA: Sec-independent protein translocase protein TatB [Rubrivivax sp.]|jgi:sec-independent protein translocase protein TatB|nr:Sec-independent protein translocase protein TatB [Rubrivivax sp.]
MIDFGFDKIALIGAVALIVIGPEKLPKVARTVGHLFGKAQRYVADVRAEVNRSIELDELKKMKTQFEDAARDVEQSVQKGVGEFQSGVQSFENDWRDATGGLESAADAAIAPTYPQYRHPKKKWRVKRGATPQWYKHKAGVRSRAQSGAARVARFRPPGARTGV